MATPPEGPSTLSLVESAARKAALTVLNSPDTRRRQHKLVLLACCLSVAAVLILVLPVAILLDQSKQKASLDRARFNCDIQTKATGFQRDILQIGTDLRRDNAALSQDERVRSAIREVFGKELVTELYAKQAANERVAVRRWDAKLAALRQLSRLDCDRVLVKGGVRTTPGPTTITSGTTTTPSRTTTAPSRTTTAPSRTTTAPSRTTTAPSR